ncbi:unnamed protein product [marine sediment metagenome]|uniref:Uncharacterized protein n=1 Tax=marine sediment metagenome TaxID=412755 RepID=X1GID4_9ZZZZ
MAIVKFSFQDEYIEELKKARLEQPIVRLTDLARHEQAVPLRSLFVISTAKAASGDIIRLEHFCGTLWNINSQDEQVLQRADIIHSEIKEACQALELEIRAGIFEG